jgi:hypothetical protein
LLSDLRAILMLAKLGCTVKLGYWIHCAPLSTVAAEDNLLMLLVSPSWQLLGMLFQLAVFDFLCYLFAFLLDKILIHQYVIFLVTFSLSLFFILLLILLYIPHSCQISDGHEMEDMTCKGGQLRELAALETWPNKCSELCICNWVESTNLAKERTLAYELKAAETNIAVSCW